jgi:uncharacterized membrane protein YeaQ/YmgE (transglycosylase-associated protein family)
MITRFVHGAKKKPKRKGKTMLFLIWMIMGIVFAFACASIAKSKNRDTASWAFGGFILGIIGLIIIAVLPEVKE